MGNRHTEAEHLAVQFVDAIKTIAQKPENLNNLQYYLECHFDIWLDKWANTPEGLVSEMREFAEMHL